MQPLNALGRQILEAVESQLIPWVSEKPPFALLSAPPKSLISELVSESPGEKLSLSRGRGLRMRVQSWPEENLNALAVPYMGCVIEGEADIITATTVKMCRQYQVSGKRWVLRAAQKTLFLVPPNVPLSSGGAPHWERANPESAYSRILWIQFHSNGIDCHFCTSDGGEHWRIRTILFTAPSFFHRQNH